MAVINNYTIYIGDIPPKWTRYLVADPLIASSGFGTTSDGITLSGPNTVVRHRRGKIESDGARWANGKYLPFLETFLKTFLYINYISVIVFPVGYYRNYVSVFVFPVGYYRLIQLSVSIM